MSFCRCAGRAISVDGKLWHSAEIDRFVGIIKKVTKKMVHIDFLPEVKRGQYTLEKLPMTDLQQWGTLMMNDPVGARPCEFQKKDGPAPCVCEICVKERAEPAEPPEV